MRTQNDNFEISETTKTLFEALWNAQIELRRYWGQQSSYDQEFRYELERIMNSLDLLMERILKDS